MYGTKERRDGGEASETNWWATCGLMGTSAYGIYRLFAALIASVRSGPFSDTECT